MFNHLTIARALVTRRDVAGIKKLLNNHQEFGVAIGPLRRELALATERLGDLEWFRTFVTEIGFEDFWGSASDIGELTMAGKTGWVLAVLDVSPLRFQETLYYSILVNHGPQIDAITRHCPTLVAHNDRFDDAIRIAADCAFESLVRTRRRHGSLADADLTFKKFFRIVGEDLVKNHKIARIAEMIYYIGSRDSDDIRRIANCPWLTSKSLLLMSAVYSDAQAKARKGIYLRLSFSHQDFVRMVMLHDPMVYFAAAKMFNCRMRLIPVYFVRQIRGYVRDLTWGVVD